MDEDKMSQMSGEVPQMSGDVPQSSGDVPQSSGDVPQSSGDVPQSSGDVPQSSGDVPQSSGKVPKKRISRAKHKCPFPSCKSSVTHLPRHMVHSHGWSKKDASTVLNTFALRKDRVKSSKHTRKRNFKRMTCPVPECLSVVKRIHNHLSDVHKLKPGTKHYKRFLSLAEPHDVITISSESSISDDSKLSSESLDESAWKPKNKRKQKKSQKYRLTSKDVYPSSNEDSVHDGNSPKASGPPDKRKASTAHPSIFKKESDISTENSESDDPGCQEEIPDEDMHDEESREESLMEDGPSFLPTKTGVDEENSGHSESGSDSEGEYSDIYNESDDFQDDELSVPQLHVTDSELFQKFTEWLRGPDGGRKNEKCARQCSRQVQLVAEAINPESPSVPDLFERKILRDSWLTQFEKKKQPGTVKSYLGSLNLFFLFLKCEQLDEQLGISQEQLGILSDQMKQWNKSYRNLIKDRFWVKRMEDLSNLKTPEHVQEFDQSQVARDAVRLLGESQDKDNGPTHKEYTGVRDYLLTLICINNGSRSGSLANMTLEEYRNAHKDEDDHVVKVKKHKTFTTHGPAHIVMSSTIYTWLGIFITQFRNKLGDVDKGNDALVFLSWNLQPMVSSHIGKQMGSCWGKVFGKESSGGGATAFRKAAVSAVQEHDEQGRGNLASLMDHHKETADKFYLLQKKSKQATIAARSLRQIMHSKTTKTNETDAPAALQRWTAEQEKIISSIFAEEIKEQNITLERVQELSKDHPVLKKFDPTKICDKIRYMYVIDSVPGALVPPQEAETSEDRLARFGIPANDVGEPSSTRSKSKQNKKAASNASEYTPSLFSATKTSTSNRACKLFDDEETEEAFRKTFSELIQTKRPIKKADVMQRIENSNLKHLAKNFKPLQLVDKVRTERKKFQR